MEVPEFSHFLPKKSSLKALKYEEKDEVKDLRPTLKSTRKRRHFILFQNIKKAIP